jgi:hypothetical protein
MKIRRVVSVRFSRAQYAFPFQSRVLKIKQQRVAAFWAMDGLTQTICGLALRASQPLYRLPRIFVAIDFSESRTAFGAGP